MSWDIINKNWGYKQFNIPNFTCKWTIHNFRFILEEMRDSIRSPTFSMRDNDKWCLRVHPKGVDEESSDYLSVYLELLSSPKSPLAVRFKFWIVNAKGKNNEPVTSAKDFNFLPGSQSGYKMFILRDFLLDHSHDLLPDDHFTLLCMGILVPYSYSIPDESTEPRSQVPKGPLGDDLGELWKNSSFTDCCLVVAGQEFRAHKAILAARSPVFRAMFEHDTEESRKNRFEIHDLKPEVFKAMMDFIYTGKEPVLHRIAGSVLAAADKYGLERLKVMCESAVCRDLSVKNAAYALCLADRHSTGHLKTQVLNFITAHASEVSQTASWKLMVDSRPHLVAEAYSSLASAQCNLLEPPLKRQKQSQETVTGTLYVYPRSSGQC
ncbi:speckle-type POZ protein-like [Alexandromys fortis]|uniref:speckle-type POZ protein-like n=1 Tax=Alexandromys fortis TaxID=100897 RepID=UPI002153766F|nr:speckle-type POZ protein-like [Microtus fortis]XP_050010123.1 speckle-type POZ protein-like [Microtus fortis]